MCNHSWDRTNAVTTDDGYDLFRCSKCGAKGRSTFVGPIIRDNETIKQKTKKRHRDYVAEYRQRKYWRELEKRIDSDAPSPLEWSLSQYVNRLEMKKSLTDTEIESLETAKRQLKEMGKST